LSGPGPIAGRLAWLAALLCVALVGCDSGGIVHGDGWGPWIPSDDDDVADDDDDVVDDDDDVEPLLEEITGAEGDPSALIYDWGEVQTFEITLEQDEYNALRVDPYTYVAADFTWEGVTYGPVGVRLKGQGSFQSIDDKPAFKVKFNEFVSGGRFLGLESITLNNMVWDYSMMHERLAYRVYREVGVPASRNNHALVYVNGMFYGLYANTESTEPHLIGQWFEDTGGSMFEGWDVDFYPWYVDSFQLDWGPDDYSNIAGLADALQTPGADGLTAAEEHVDLDNFLRYWAVGAVVAQFDAYPYTSPGDDFQVYDDPTSGTLWFMPWGTDETFYYPDNSITSVNGILASRCREVVDCRAAWEAQVWEVMDRVEALDWVALFDEVADEIGDHVQADPRRPYDMGTVSTYQSSMRQMMANRRAALESQIGAP